MRVLAVSPHCCYMEMGVGGYIAALSKRGGSEMLLVVVSEGAAPVGSGIIDTASRVREQEAAAHVLGIENAHLGFREEGLSGENMAAIVSALQDHIELFRPHEFLLPLQYFDSDFRVVFDACAAALRPVGGGFRPARALAYESALNTWGPSVPTWGKVYIPLTAEQLHLKVEALSCHRSQMRGREETLGGTLGVTQLARLRGLECGAESGYAELLYLLREIAS